MALRLRGPVLLILIAFIPRLLVLMTSINSPIFNYPVIDSQVYHETAIRIANGDIMGSTAFWQAPLYPYFLGLVYWVFGVKIIIGKIVGLILGAVNCYLIFRLAIKIAGRRAAWIAYIISLFYGPFIYFEAQLLAPALLNFLILLALLAIDAYGQSHKIYMLIIIGIILSLAQISHGLIIAYLPFLMGWFLYRQVSPTKKLRNGLVTCGWLLVGFATMIIITAIHNFALDREFIPVSSNFGPNFYLGNHPNYDSTTTIRPGLEWDEFISEAAVAGNNTPATISSYYTRKAISNIISDIPAFIGLLAKKLYYLSAGEEIKRNLDIYHFKQYSIFLDALIWYRMIAFPSGIIIPLAVCGILIFMVLVRNSDGAYRRWPALLFLISQVLAILLFFVSSRYRVTLMPVVIIFAADAVAFGTEWIKQRRWQPFVITLTLFAVFLVFCNQPRIKIGNRDLAENQFYEGLAMSVKGEISNAVDRYNEALRLYPDYAMASYNLALSLKGLGRDSAMSVVLNNILEDHPHSYVVMMYVGEEYLNQGLMDNAKELFFKALDINPNAADAYIDLGFIYRTQGDIARAMQYLNKAIEINPRAYKAYNHIGACHLMYDRLGQAEQSFRKALAINRSYASARNNLATICSRTNRFEEAEELLEAAVNLDPDNVEILINYGFIRLRRGDYEAALGYFDRAVKMAPAAPMTHYSRGLALVRLGRSRQAAEAFISAIKADSSFAPARDELKKLGMRI